MTNAPPKVVMVKPDLRTRLKRISLWASIAGFASQALTLINPTLVLTLWNLMPVEVRDLIPPKPGLVIGLVLFAIVIVRTFTRKEPAHAS